MVAIHEVNFGRDVDFSNQNFVLGLKCFAILLLNNVSNLADFALTRGPDLNQRLLKDVIAQIGEPIIGQSLATLGHAVDA